MADRAVGDELRDFPEWHESRDQVLPGVELGVMLLGGVADDGGVHLVVHDRRVGVNEADGFRCVAGVAGFLLQFARRRFQWAFAGAAAKLVVSLLKFVVIFGFTYPVIKDVLNDPIFHTTTDFWYLLVFMGQTAQGVGLRVVAGMVVIAAADFAYQRWKTEQDSMMTKQEVKQELKQQEGDPMMRSRVRNLQREMSQQRMMDDVMTADVVVTNPTHVAVALKYDMENMPAPLVVAKGQRLVAQRIKEIARDAGIPLVENKPLARALFKVVRIGDEIPEDLFKAVAQVLAFVFQLKRGNEGNSL